MLKYFAPLFFFTLSPSTTYAITSTEARACFTEVLDKAKKGDTFANLVSRHVSKKSVARIAATFSPYKGWDNTPPAIQKKIVSLITETLVDDGSFGTIDLNSVKIVGKGKVNNAGYELSGNFKTHGSQNTFSVVFVDNCTIINITWNNINLARHIGKQIELESE